MTIDHAFYRNLDQEYPDYLRDESRRTGTAESISFPPTEAALREHLAELHRLGIPVTIQGARTGITGGAVPNGGHVLSLTRMNRITGLRRSESGDGYELSVQPGALLSDLRQAVEKKAFDTAGWSKESLETLEAFRKAGAFFFPPDPTEASASLGGMVACNASGARTFLYGATRSYVESLRVVLADGSLLRLARGREKAEGRHFSLVTDDGKSLSGDVPGYGMPAVKNASGYFAAEDMDLIDLFIGSEGTLGVISEIGVRLAPQPGAMWGVMCFFPGEEAAIRFVRRVRAAEARPAAVEFFNHGALDLLRGQKKTNPAFADTPDLPAAWHTCVYVEYHGADEAAVEAAVTAMSERMAECGGDADATWLAADEREMARVKHFRHAVPEAVNLLIDQRRKQAPGLTKLGTDLAVPDEHLERVMAMYRRDLDAAGLEYVIFGHIGDNHVHVNIIPRAMEEYRRGKELYVKWADEVVRMGGSVSAEHGIGKMKTEMLARMFGEEGIRQMREVKRCFDPEGRLNPGNLF